MNVVVMRGIKVEQDVIMARNAFDEDENAFGDFVDKYGLKMANAGVRCFETYDNFYIGDVVANISITVLLSTSGRDIFSVSDEFSYCYPDRSAVEKDLFNIFGESYHVFSSEDLPVDTYVFVGVESFTLDKNGEIAITEVN